MDKENGKSGDNTSGSSKLSNHGSNDPASLLDAASLFGAYWPRGDANAASAASLFAASGGFGLPQHPYGMLPPTSTSRGLPSYPTSSAAAAYTNAYTNTLSVAASQAASLGIPAASAAWWSMASHLAAQDYLARLQASGLNFPSLGNSADPYASLGLSLGAAAGQSHHKSSKNSKTSSSSLPKGHSGSSRDKLGSPYGASKLDHHNSHKYEQSLKASTSMSNSKHSQSSHKYSSSSLTIQPSMKLPSSNNDKKSSNRHSITPEHMQAYMGMGGKQSSTETKTSKSSSGGTCKVTASSGGGSIFTSPLSMASNSDKASPLGGAGGTTLNSNSVAAAAAAAVANLPSSILSDPNSILGGVRLPPDTEIIKYTSSIVGPKIPGTTNRGRKKTISLDPPIVSVHPSHSSTGMLIEHRANKRQKLNDAQDLSGMSSGHGPNDRIELIKLPSTNGSPSGISGSSFGGSELMGDTPLNLSLKPTASTPSNSSLNSLSNMSASIGSDRISRRKPGPKPRRVVPTGGPPTPTSMNSGASTPLSQLFVTADSPRPPSRNEGSDGGSSTSSTCTASAPNTSMMSSSSSNHKEGRPRNLGRGVSKPKKNTVASLLAQSRALGIKPVPMLDPSASMNQQLSFLKSNILAAQQYISEAGGDEKVLNKLLQEKFRGTLSDTSTVDASDSDNFTDSYHTDSELEQEMSSKKQKQFDERALRIPLELGWKRETIIRGLTKNGGLKGDVTYNAPDSANKFKQMSDVTQYLEYQKNADLTKDNFTFSCRVILGEYLQPVPPEMAIDGEFIRLTEEDVTKRLEELKAAMRTSLPVEQRIEMARKQQAARAAARIDREQARLVKEIERSERQEAARRDREVRSQQLLEAKRKKQEEHEKHKLEEQQRRQQEREIKRQQAAIIKEQMYIQEISKQREMLYTVELERERRRQHMSLVKALENRRKLEEKERKKQQLLAEKQANKEKKMEQRKIEMEILSELRKPCEDLELDQKPLPEFARIMGLKLPGKAYADILMVFEFLHNFGETLGFDMESLPTLDSLQQALLPNDHSLEAEEELFSVMTHLLVCAVEDPGIPNPARHTTILGQSLKQADITHVNLSEILRIYLYANATGEVKALTGVHFERDREKRVADHHQNDNEMQQTQSGKNSQYYETLHGNRTWKLSDMLKDKPFMALSPTHKAEILAFICNELLQNKAVIRQIEGSLEHLAQQRKEKWMMDNKIRKLKMLHGRKVRSEAIEKSQKDLDGLESAADSPALHKDDLLDEEDNDMSENESLGTQPEEEEDNKLPAEELGKKLEKLVKTSETQLQSLNSSTHQLRATYFGQDRYYRKYWTLPKAGGIFVESLESSDADLLQQFADNDVKNNEIKETVNLSNHIGEQKDCSVDREVNEIVDDKQNEEKVKENNNVEENEHRKTPNRVDIVENGDSEEMDKNERNLAELQKSVDDIVQNLERAIEQEKDQSEKPGEPLIKTETEEQDCLANKKFNLFEKLGQCMERENKSEEDLKADVKAEIKEELKNEILNELKSEIKNEIKQEPAQQHESDQEKSEQDSKWFSILHKEDTCEGVHLTAGNRFENGVGACTRDNLTELKIPVFPPPGSNASYSYLDSCDSPLPLQMTSEESVQLEYIKKHGMPKACNKQTIPFDKRYGWWRITDIDQLREVLENLHVRGARERDLKRNIITIMQAMYEKKRMWIEEGVKDLTELIGENLDEVEVIEGGAILPDAPEAWSAAIAQRCDTFLLDQVEALEDKVASASMQVKGWKPPGREDQKIAPEDLVSVARERLMSLEVNIERRYLKPPLGINTGDPNLAAMSQETTANNPTTTNPNTQSTSSTTSTSSSTSNTTPTVSDPDIPKGLAVWRDAVRRCQTSAQLAMCQYSLEASIAWDKSIMKANCQFCSSGDNEDKLLLCDSCDKGYHTYCFKPKMDNIPDGDWYCHECMNKATGERNCIVCGKRASSSGTKLILCELCPRSYHIDCMQPALQKAPRGKWYCVKCISKKPQKKPVRRNVNKNTRDSESSDHPPPPSSPAPSLSSVTTNEDQQAPTNCNQSDISNSSIANAGSPVAPMQTTPKKDRLSKKLIKDLAPCKAILEELECHDDAWPFLLPVNTKQFPTYKKIIKNPMDLSTIKKRLQDMTYKSKEDFCTDVRLIFNNCEIFNEDDSPVGKAGHCMRQFFEAKLNEMYLAHS